MTVCTARDGIWLDRVGFKAGNQLGHHNAFMGRFVGQPRRTCDIANREHAIHTRAAVFVCDDVRAVNFDAEFFET